MSSCTASSDLRKRRKRSQIRESKPTAEMESQSDTSPSRKGHRKRSRRKPAPYIKPYQDKKWVFISQIPYEYSIWCEWRYRTFWKIQQYQWVWDFRTTNFLALNSTKIYTVKAIVEKQSPFSMPENAVIRVEKPLFFSLYSAFCGDHGYFTMRRTTDGYGR